MKQTSAELSRVAGRYLGKTNEQIMEMVRGDADQPNAFELLCDDIRSLAASVLSQDETPAGAEKSPAEKAEAARFDDLLDEYLDPDGETKKLANELGKLMLSADENHAVNAAIAAVALLHADPEIEKDNAIELAVKFGAFVAEELKENWSDLLAIRQKFHAWKAANAS